APKRLHDRSELVGRPATEKRERDVHLLSRDETTSSEMLRLPEPESVPRGCRKLEGEEESKEGISFDATRRAHASSCRFRVRTRRARCSAATVARERIVSRSAGSENSPASLPPRVATWKWTRPTGLSSVPPPGPATPVTAIPTSTPSRDRIPSAIAAATSAETAPCSAINSSATPSWPTLTSSAYAITEPAKTSLDPGTSVRRAATSPPVHDSAVP